MMAKVADEKLLELLDKIEEPLEQAVNSVRYGVVIFHRDGDELQLTVERDCSPAELRRIGEALIERAGASS